MITKIGEFQGKKTLGFYAHEEDTYAISMGARKLAAVIQCPTEVLNFLNEHGGDMGKKAVEAFLKQYRPVTGANGEVSKKTKKVKKVPARSEEDEE